MNIIYLSDKYHKTVNRVVLHMSIVIQFLFIKEYTILKVQAKSLTLLI